MLLARCPAVAQTCLQVDVNLKNLQSDSDQLKVNDAADKRDHHQNSDLLLLGDGLFPSHLTHIHTTLNTLHPLLVTFHVKRTFVRKEIHP